MYKNILFLVIVILGIATIVSAAPTAAPTSGNISIPIFGNDTSSNGSALSTASQSKHGLAATGSSPNLVRHALSIGPASFPSYDATLYSTAIKAGSLSLSNDSFVVRTNMTVQTGTLTISKTSGTSTDGVLTVGGLTGTGNRPLCANSSKQLIVCP